MENLIKLAEQGNAYSQHELAIKYYQMGDEASAFTWIKKAAEQGLCEAQINIAKFYENGIGVEQDFHHALCWYEKAAQQGDTDAMNDLALYYYNGQGCNVDYDKTLMWWKEAARLGHPQATYNLGISYHNGEIVEKSFSKAKNFFLQAEKLGFEAASTALANMEDEYDSSEDAEFADKEFSYSIDVAAKIYTKFTTQEAANKGFYEQLKSFFIKKGKEFECLEGNGIIGFEEIIYKNDEQTISVLTQFKNEPYVSAIILPTYGAYTRNLFEEGLSNKCLFGLPIFSMQWFDEADRAFIYFIDRESYLKYDTPQGRRDKELFGF